MKGKVAFAIGCVLEAAGRCSSEPWDRGLITSGGDQRKISGSAANSLHFGQIFASAHLFSHGPWLRLRCGSFFLPARLTFFMKYRVDSPYRLRGKVCDPDVNDGRACAYSALRMHTQMLHLKPHLSSSLFHAFCYEIDVFIKICINALKA